MQLFHEYIKEVLEDREKKGNAMYVEYSVQAFQSEFDADDEDVERFVDIMEEWHNVDTLIHEGIMYFSLKQY